MKSISQQLEFAKNSGIPKSKINTFISLASRKQIDSVLNLNKILRKLNLSQNTMNKAMKVYIEKHAQIPVIELSNTNSSSSSSKHTPKERKTSSIHITGSTTSNTSSSKKRTSLLKRKSPSPAPEEEIASMLLDLKRNTTNNKQKNQKNNKFHVSLKTVLNRNVSVVNNGKAIQVGSKQFKVPHNRKHIVTNIPSNVSKPLLSKFIANEFHPLKARRHTFSSTNDLVNRASQDARTARLLGNALRMRLPKTLFPHHKQKIKNATLQYLKNGTLPQPKTKTHPPSKAKDPMTRLSRERNALVNTYLRHPNQNMLNKVEAKSQEMMKLLNLEREKEKALQQEYDTFLRKSRKQVGNNYVYNENVLTENELKRAEVLRRNLKLMEKKLNKQWDNIQKYNNVLYGINNYNGTIGKEIKEEMKRFWNGGSPVTGNYVPPPVKFRKVAPVQSKSATRSRSTTTATNNGSISLGSVNSATQSQ
jgi:hypothetical protein